LEYYDGINQGDDYLCDRCNVSKLRYDEYENNIRNMGEEQMRYCDECRNYIVLKRFKCNKCGNTGTMRNERILPKICCGELLVWSL